MTGWAAAMLATPASLALAGCVAGPPAEAGPAPPVAPVGPAPSSPPALAPPAPVRPAFELDGEQVQGGLAHGRAPAGAVAATLDGRAVELAPDGGFVIGFDRDAPQEALLVATLADGRAVERRLAIAPTDWSTQRVNVAFRPGGESDDDYAERRVRETGAIAAARAAVTPAAGWREPVRWPVRGRISGRFGNQRIYRDGVRGSPHSGVDVAVPTGTPVLAPMAGVVVLASDGPFALEGNLVILDHGHGLSSAFLHLSRITVVVGEAVAQGQPLAEVGATGRATGPHLHWTLRWNGQRLDPQRAAERADP